MPRLTPDLFPKQSPFANRVFVAKRKAVTSEKPDRDTMIVKFDDGTEQIVKESDGWRR